MRLHPFRLVIRHVRFSLVASDEETLHRFTRTDWQLLPGPAWRVVVRVRRFADRVGEGWCNRADILPASNFASQQFRVCSSQWDVVTHSPATLEQVAALVAGWDVQKDRC